MLMCSYWVCVVLSPGLLQRFTGAVLGGRYYDSSLGHNILRFYFVFPAGVRLKISWPCLKLNRDTLPMLEKLTPLVCLCLWDV